MLNEGHIDLNSVQFCSDSLKGRLKQTMLNQELMFMGQVIELHRLYRIQTAMTDGRKQKGLDDYQPDTRAVNSSLNSQAKSFMSGMHCSTPGHKPKPLDLQLSADEFIRQSANAPVRGSFIEAKLRGHTMDIDLDLSLGRGEETSKKGEHRSWLGKAAAREPPPEIIDLENPNSENLNRDANHGFSSPISSLREKHVFKKSVIGSASNSAAPMSRPVRDEDRIFHRLMFGNSGLNGDTAASNTPVPQRPMTLDLNVIQLDDQPDLTNTNSITFNSLVEAFHRSTGELNLNRRAQTHDIGHMLDNLMGVNRTSVASNMPEDNRGKTPFIDLVSDSDSDESGVAHLSTVSDTKVESVGSSSLSHGLRPCGFETGEAVGPESGFVMEPNPNPKPVCENGYGVELYRTASDPKIENDGSSLKLSNGFETPCDAVVLESGLMVDPNPNPDPYPNPKPVCKNDYGVGPYITTAYPKLDFGGSSSKLSNGQLQSGFEKGKAVGPESGLVVGPNPKPVCQNDYGVGAYITTAYPKLDFGGSSSKLSNRLLQSVFGLSNGLLQSGFEKGKAVGPEPGLVVGPNPKPVFQTESGVNHWSDPKIESLGSSSELLNGLLTCDLATAEMVLGPKEDPNPNPNPKPLCENNSAVELTQNGSDPKLPCGFETGEVVVGLESGFKEDPNPKPVCQNNSGVELYNNGSDPKPKLPCGFEKGEVVVLESGFKEDPNPNPNPKPVCQTVSITENLDSNTLILSKTEESDEGEIVKNAAALLIQLSRDKSAEFIDFSTKLVSKQHEEQNQPQRSIDSYEAMVLNAKECGPEDYSISSNAFVVDVPQEKASDGKYKLKRGSRLKNFQKDVLSSLSSLSRHEIREDINIFDGVIRSREYKRMRANNKMLDETDWFIPKRGRRSRLGRN